MSAALADVSTTETGPVRAFLRALTAEAAPVGDWPGCGVLLIGHSTKAAGDAPDAGVVAGSAAWHDGARGVLTMTELAGDERLIECAKATCHWCGATCDPILDLGDPPPVQRRRQRADAQPDASGDLFEAAEA